MPTDDYDDEYDDRDAGESTAMRELRKANRAKDKQLGELKEQLAAITKSVRERSVKDVLAAKGLPAKIAAFVPETATTSEDVEAWIAEYGDVFGVQSQGDEGQNDQQGQSEFDANAAALARISGQQATGQTYSGDPTQLEALIKGADGPEALNKILFGTAAGPNAF